MKSSALHLEVHEKKAQRKGNWYKIEQSKKERRGPGESVICFMIKQFKATVLRKKEKKKRLKNGASRADGERVNCHHCEKFSARERKGEQPCFSTLITSNSSLRS